MMLAAWRKFVAPGKFGAVEPTARGKFPFGFGRQILARPFGVSQRVAEGDVHDRMIVEPVDVALRPVGMTPIGAFKNATIRPNFADRHGCDGGVKTSEPA